jgi:hypothetical protein
MKRPRPGLPDRGQIPATTYFPAVQYHRRQRLNCCVRDGNRCFPLPVVTEKPGRRSRDDRTFVRIVMDGRPELSQRESRAVESKRSIFGFRKSLRVANRTNSSC